jgi:hypothetical protein
LAGKSETVFKPAFEGMSVAAFQVVDNHYSVHLPPLPAFPNRLAKWEMPGDELHLWISQQN